MKLCIITCYNQPDYVRAKTLRAAAELIDGVDIIVIKNASRGLLRYPQVAWSVLKMRLTQKPDAYLLTFRGYEMLLPIRLLTLRKPLIYDEFINPIEWAIYEHRKLSPKNPLTWVFTRLYGLLLRSVDLILTDTQSHAELSAELTKRPRDQFFSIPVGTDETTFVVSKPEDTEAEYFTLFYYGNMLPLHGLEYVLDAAVKLNHEKVRFVLVGGNDKVAHDVALAVGNGANIEYKTWVEFDKLPKLMREADLCLAGPFGNTYQAGYVITGKAFQYLAMGRPTVIGMNRESEVFTHQHDALVVRQGNGDNLADTIRWAMTHREELRQIGLNGQKLYQTKFATPHLSERLAEGLARVTSAQAATGANQ